MIQAVVESADPDSWRNALRQEITDQDVLALIRRAGDAQACQSQPNDVLVQLADGLRRSTGHQLMAAFSKSVNWQIVNPTSLESKEGVTLTTQPDGSIVASGALPDSDTVTVETKIAVPRISAVRLEFVPELRSDGYLEKNLGRNGTLVIREIQVLGLPGKNADETTDGTAPQMIRVPFAFADFHERFSVAPMCDGDLSTFKTILQRKQPRTFVLTLEPFDFTGFESLQIKVTSGSYPDSTASRFRIAIASEEFPSCDLQSSAINLLEQMSRKDPTDYWVRMELSTSYRRQFPPQFEDAIRHGSAAVALQPDQEAADVAVLRALPQSHLRDDNRYGRLARLHVGRIFDRDEDNTWIGKMTELAYQSAFQFANAGDVVGANSSLRLALELDGLSKTSNARAALLNQFAWDLVKDPKKDVRQIAGIAAKMAEQAFAKRSFDSSIANTVGVAHYRNEDWLNAIKLLEKSAALSGGGNEVDWIVLAMAHAQLDDRDVAKECFEKAIRMSEEGDTPDAAWVELRKEAESVLGVDATRDDE